MILIEQNATVHAAARPPRVIEQVCVGDAAFTAPAVRASLTPPQPALAVARSARREPREADGVMTARESAIAFCGDASGRPVPVGGREARARSADRGWLR